MNGRRRLRRRIQTCSVVSPARAVALDVLDAVRRGEPADNAFDRACASRPSLAAADRGLAMEIAYGVLRRWRRLDGALGEYARQGLPKEAGLLDLLRVGAYQLLFLDRVPAHAAVSTAVDAARERAPHAATFVNAVLRRVAAEAPRLRAAVPPPEDAPVERLAAWHSVPDWLAERLAPLASSAAGLGSLLEALTRPAPLCLRATPHAGGRDRLLEALAREGAPAHAAVHAPDALIVERRSVAAGGAAGSEVADVRGLPGFEEGWFTVQDEAAQLIVELLEVRSGVTMLDLCAAPGGKAIHAAHRGARVVAVDADAARLRLVDEASRRLRAPVETLAATAGAAGVAPLAGRLFDRVLVDAPCSATGILRRKPDVAWRRRPDDLAELRRRQSEILEGGASHVAPGGRLVYAVCSLLPEEGEAVADAFDALHAAGHASRGVDRGAVGFRRVDLRGGPASIAPFVTARGDFRARPDLHRTDGFFAATWIRLGDGPLS